MTDDDDQPQETEYVSSMPFVVTRSNGGTLDDDTFTFGFEAGMIYSEAAACAALQDGSNVIAVPRGRPVHTEIVSQVDLIAMRFGYVIETQEIEDDDEWTWVNFNIGSTELEEDDDDRPE